MVKEYYYNDVCTVTAIPDKCCRFLYWVDTENRCDPISYENPFSFYVNNKIKYEAVFEKIKYNVYITTNNDVYCCTAGEGQYNCGDSVTITAKAAECFNIRWGDSNMAKNGTSETIKGITTITYTIEEINSDVYASVILEVVKQNICVNACPENGGSADIVKFSNLPNAYEAQYICENSEMPTYDICSILENGECNIMQCGDFMCGDMVTLIANPNEEFIFGGWKRGDCVDCSETYGYISSENVFNTIINGNEWYVACFYPKIWECVVFHIKTLSYLAKIEHYNQILYVWVTGNQYVRVPKNSKITIYLYNSYVKDYGYSIPIITHGSTPSSINIPYNSQSKLVNCAWIRNIGVDYPEYKIENDEIGFVFTTFEINNIINDMYFDITEVSGSLQYDGNYILPAMQNNSFYGESYIRMDSIFNCQKYVSD